MIQVPSERRPRGRIRREREALLEGTHDSADAKVMVADLLGSAIRFHRLRELRERSRTGPEQLARLERTLSEWKELLAEAGRNGSKLRVTTSIRLGIVPESGSVRRSVDWD